MAQHKHNIKTELEKNKTMTQKGTTGPNRKRSGEWRGD